MRERGQIEDRNSTFCPISRILRSNSVHFFKSFSLGNCNLCENSRKYFTKFQILNYVRADRLSQLKLKCLLHVACQDSFNQNSFRTEKKNSKMYFGKGVVKW